MHGATGHSRPNCSKWPSWATFLHVCNLRKTWN